MSLDAFSVVDNKLSIEFGEAIMRSEMSLLGDVMLGTVPNIKFTIKMDLDKGTEVPAGGGKCRYCIKNIEMYAGAKLIEDKKDKNLLFDLIRFGVDARNLWEETKNVKLEKRKVESITYEYIHTEDFDEEPGEDYAHNLALLSSLSTIISRKYNILTAPEGEIQKLFANCNQDFLDVYFPLWPRKQLPLFVLHQEQNDAREHD